GVSSSILNNCTVTGNSALGYQDLSYYAYGGGALSCALNNCIVYFNTAANDANVANCTLNFCCTMPPARGPGNISVDPQLASLSRLSAGSPCRRSGSAAYVSGTDIDGEKWANPPSIGCDEYHPGALTGPLSVSIVATFTNVSVGMPVSFVA